MTINLPDQIEIENLSFHSGSSSDRVFTEGNIFDDSRRVAFSKVNPFVSGDKDTRNAAINDRLIGITQSIDVWYERFYEPSYLNRPIYKDFEYLALELRSESEIYADSILPSPVEIFLRNSGALLEGWENGHQLNPSIVLTSETTALPKFPRKFKMIMAVSHSSVANLDSHITSSAGKMFSDNIWAWSFPFENRYRDLERLPVPKFTKEYPCAFSQSYEVPAYDIYAATDPFSGSIHTVEFVFQTSIARFKQFYTLAKSEFKFDTPPTTAASYYSNAGPTTHADNLLINKAFFGFYVDGPSRGLIDPPNFLIESGLTNYPPRPIYNPGKFPLIVPGQPIGAPGPSAASSHFLFLGNFGVRLTGWKYGVFNGRPVTSKCVFRRNRFGQFRDLLEQRPDTKYYDIKTSTAGPSPIQYTFASGSNAAVTSSNPTVLNPTVSGIWDFEAKSGKPFDDTWNGTV